MTFTEFVDAAAEPLATVGGKIMQRRESDPEAGSWWVAFRRAAVLYRLRFDRGLATLFLEREQGSFVANSPSKWQRLESRDPGGLDFETALETIGEVVQKRWPSAG